MKMFALVLLLATNVQASTLSLFCEKSTGPAGCRVQIQVALARVGCEVARDMPFDCQFTLREDPRHPGATIPSDKSYCELSSVNCESPHPGNFGGENCYAGKKITLSKSDGVHNGYWMGLFGSYSRTICKAM